MESSRIITTKRHLARPSEGIVIEISACIFMNVTISESSWRLKCELNFSSCRSSVTYILHQAKHEYIDFFKKCSS
jgi:hypothetical protein